MDLFSKDEIVQAFGNVLSWSTEPESRGIFSDLNPVCRPECYSPVCLEFFQILTLCCFALSVSLLCCCLSCVWPSSALLMRVFVILSRSCAFLCRTSHFFPSSMQEVCVCVCVCPICTSRPVACRSRWPLPCTLWPANLPRVHMDSPTPLCPHTQWSVQVF